MIEHRLDKDGKVEAYCTWRIVNADGRMDDLGKFVFVDELWIHKSVFKKSYIRDFIKTISEKAPTAMYGYWVRPKYGNRSKIFSREQLNKEG